MILRQETLRETLKNDQGQVTVIINLSFPSLYKSESGKAPCKTFCRFYRKAAEGFRRFAGEALCKKAEKNPPGTPPCGAVLWFRHQETEDTLTVTLGGSVFDGFSTYPLPEDVRIWEKKTGLLQ